MISLGQPNVKDKEASQQALIEKLFEPFIKEKKRSFTYKCSSTGRSYRVCSCCGHIQFYDDPNSEHSLHSHQSQGVQKNTFTKFNDEESEKKAESPFQFITQVVQATLQKYYDQIDKYITLWSKKQKQRASTLFIDLMEKLSQIFVNFEADLNYLLKIKIDHADFVTSNSNYQCFICQKLKEYSISKFPLLKDFMNNFDMRELNEKQKKNLQNLSKQYCLVHKILEQLNDKQMKRIEKKMKKTKKQKPLGQKKTEQNRKTGSKVDQNMDSNTVEKKETGKSWVSFEVCLMNQDFNEYNETIKRLSNMKIIKQQRTFCYF